MATDLLGRRPLATHVPCWCGGEGWRLLFRTPRFGLVRCSSCGCYRTDPPPLRSDVEAPDFYGDFYARLEEAGSCAPPAAETRVSRFWRVAERHPSLLTVAHAATDVGCGDGRLCAELRSAGWPDVLGLDVSASRIAKARRLYPGIRFSDQPIAATGLDLASVDLMVLDNVIEHLPAPAPLLSELRDYVAPDGRLVVITPNMRSGNFRLLGRFWTTELSPDMHIFLFTAATLRRLLEQTGYVVDYTGSFPTPLYPWHDGSAGLSRAGVKEIVWRAAQNAGHLYGRLLGAGAMVYAVARPSGRPAVGAP